ncbi:serine/threonine-protein kinase [Glycomyces paridis]|uniref:non-specific serine/threonine protein kinase n=1 Tax=Glycomyces paridis TaxID=2126555 RepID=A0A4S8PI08_9ACTN|nr:serine/threonine-protein kinase [Glycomyces paridis]THV30238.1 serine/threonine protein kinase [Glycomyces paridis]
MDAGTVIGGRFRLEERLATGGMGAVWRAHDLRLDREAAVKVLRSDLDDTDRPVARFSREATTLAKLKGTGFVEIYDFGEEEVDGFPIWFIAMELIATGSLGRLLAERGRLTSAETLQLLAEAAAALEKAHRIDVVHRDIKPANLLIDDEGHVRVVDFGISLLNSSPRLTPTSAVFGTLAYISPEQLRRGEIAGRSDVYSLGAVAYECLTGAPPFDASDPAAEMHGHLYEEPAALPEEVTPEAAGIVLRCLRKDPEERYESAAALAAACHAALGVSTPPPTTSLASPAPAPEPAQVDTKPEPTQRGRRLLITAAVILALLAAGTAVTRPWNLLRDNEDGTKEPTKAVEQTTNATSAAATTAAEETTTAPEATASDDPPPAPETGGGETDTNDSGDTGGGSDTDETEPETSGSGTVPQVTRLSTHDAEQELAEAGFDNVHIEGAIYSWFGVEWDNCEVLEQTPTSGETADFDDQIVLGYYTDTDEDPADCT